MIQKGDPFGGDYSRDGRPTKPRLMLPKNQAIFDHYPRFIDFRWYLSSGVYPITYDIEVAHGQCEVRPGSELAQLVFPFPVTFHARVPYYLGGMG